MKLIFRGKEYQSFSECFKDNKDIARVSIPTFVKRVREGMPIEQALSNPKGRTLVTRLGSHLVEGIEYENLPSIARAYGIKEMRVYRRFYNGKRGDDLVPPKLRKNYTPPPPKLRPKSKWTVTINGTEYKSYRDVCRQLGVNVADFTNRRARGYTINQALGFEPIVREPRKLGKVYEIDGEKYTLTEVGKKFKINLTTFLRRIDRGFSPKEAATMKRRQESFKKNK